MVNHAMKNKIAKNVFVGTAWALSMAAIITFIYLIDAVFEPLPV